MLLLLLLALPASAQVSYEPLQTTVEGRLIPGDSVRIVVSNREERESHFVIYFQRGEERVVLSRGTVSPKGSAELSVSLPWARSILVEVGGERGELPISPETRLSVVTARGKFLDVQENTWLKVTVALRTNMAGERAKVRIVDESENRVLKEEEVVLIDGYAHDFYVKIGENPSLLPLLKELQRSRPLRVELVVQDTFPDNNADYLYLTVRAPDIWRIPWGFLVGLAGIAAIAALLLLTRWVFS